MKKLMILSAVGLLMLSSIGCTNCRMTRWWNRGAECCDTGCENGDCPTAPGVVIPNTGTVVNPGPTQ